MACNLLFLQMACNLLIEQLAKFTVALLHDPLMRIRSVGDGNPVAEGHRSLDVVGDNSTWYLSEFMFCVSQEPCG